MTADGFTLDSNTRGLYRLKEVAASGAGHNACNDVVGTRHLVANAIDICKGPAAGRLAKRLNGSSHYAEVAGDAASQAMLVGEWTVRAWVYVDSLAADRYILTYSGSGESQAANYLIAFYIQATNGRLGMFTESGSGVNATALQTSGTAVPVDTWSHVACKKTISGANATYEFWVNGVSQGSATVTKADGGTDAACKWTMGRDGVVGSPYYLGRLSGIAVRGSAMSGAAILAEAGAAGVLDTATDFVAWPMQEDPDWKDASSYGWHLRETSALVKITSTPTGGGRYFPRGSTVEARAALLAEMRAFWLGEWTFEVYMRVGDEPSAIVGVFCFGDPGPEDQPNNFLGSFEINTDRTGTAWWEHGAGSDSTWTTPALFDVAGAKGLHHVAIVKRLSGGGPQHVIDLVVDGVLLGTSGALTNADGGQNAFLRIGVGNAEAGFYGVLESIRISDVARSLDELEESYLAGLATKDDQAPTIDFVTEP